MYYIPVLLSPVRKFNVNKTNKSRNSTIETAGSTEIVYGWTHDQIDTDRFGNSSTLVTQYLDSRMGEGKETAFLTKQKQNNIFELRDSSFT